MQLTREGDYGLRAMAYLASQSNGDVISASVISKKQSIPPKFLARIMPKLVKKNIIISIPGSKGGYKLSRPPENINFLEVYEALEGSLALNICLLEPHAECQLEEKCSIRPVWRGCQNLVKDYFGNITFDKLKIPL